MATGVQALRSFPMHQGARQITRALSVYAYQHSAMATPHHLRPRAVSNSHPPKLGSVALKEWAVAIEALHRGEQTILLRKGGIREPIFSPPGKRFVLFPTAFHTEANLLKPGLSALPWYQQQLALDPKLGPTLPLTTFVEVTGAWVTEDPRVLHVLDDLHIWTQDFVEARLKWRAKQPLTLLELRAWRIKPSLSLQVKDEFFGCFMFVDLASGLTLAEHKHMELEPALEDHEFESRQQLLRERLSSIDHVPFHLQCHA